jgi:autotransporter-associated beta strand protein
MFADYWGFPSGEPEPAVISRIGSKRAITMKTIILAAVCCSLMLFLPTVGYAISAEWDLNPISGDWNTAADWIQDGVPNGPADIAIFGLSHTTDVSISADTDVNAIRFTTAASAYTITAGPGFTLTISGAGITNNSGMVQKFVTAAGRNYNYANLVFTNSASAGSSTRFTNVGADAPFTAGGVSGETSFYNTSTAANGLFINRGATYLAGYGGFTNFFGNSTADNGSFTNNGGTFTGFGIGSSGGATRFIGASTAANATITSNPATVSGSHGGSTQFYNTSTASAAMIVANGATISSAGAGGTEFFEDSTAANATIVSNGGTASGAIGGSTRFSGASTAGSATLIANGGINGGQGGLIVFADMSTGGTSRLELFGNGRLDIRDRSASPSVTIGSIEGDGTAVLGAHKLIVGSNELSTTFSGVIQGDGSLTKIGSGTLILSGANTYMGTTNVNRGMLQVDGSITSNTFVDPAGTLAGTGTINGNVINRAGTLAGTETINGNVTNKGRVSPGSAGVPGMLAVVHNYTQGQYAHLMLQIAGANAGQFSVLDILGTANLSGLLNPDLLNGFVPTVGETFTFLNYGAVNGTLFIFNPNIDNVAEHWEISYFPTFAVLTVTAGNVPVPDQASTLLLLMLGLSALLMCRPHLVRKQT